MFLLLSKIFTRIFVKILSYIMETYSHPGVNLERFERGEKE